MTALQQCHFEHEIHRLHSYFSMLRYQYKNTGQSVTRFDNLCIVVLAFSLLHNMPLCIRMAAPTMCYAC